MEYKIKRLTETCIEVRMYYGQDSNKFKFLLSADWHWDNPKCDRGKLKGHLEQAKSEGAGVFCFGDLFCAMQGKYDKRSAKTDIRPEHQKNNYLDALVNTCAKWVEPYKDNLVMISEGNHETSIKRHHETDIVERLTTLIETEAMPYKGWVQFVWESKGGGAVRRKTLAYNHGYGGGGPVTKGTIQTNRRAIYLPDAQLVVAGHVHESWTLEICRERINHLGQSTIDTQTHIQLPTYKEEYLQGKGWHIETGKPPKPLGAYWIEFEVNARQIKQRIYRAE